MVKISERNIVYAVMGTLVLVAAAGLNDVSGINNGIVLSVVLVLCALGAGITYASFKMGYIVMPIVTGVLGVTEILGNGYKIPPSQDVVLRNVGGIYHATIFMTARFYEAASSETEEKMTTAYMDLWERALSGVRFPFKFCLISYLDDISKYREEIETKRYSATIKLGKIRENPNPDPLAIDRYEREISKMNAMLARLTEGEKPMGVVMYCATTGIGVNEGAALAAAQTQVAEVRSTVANALNVEIKPVKGEDLKKCFKWELAIPPEKNEFTAQL